MADIILSCFTYPHHHTWLVFLTCHERLDINLKFSLETAICKQNTQWIRNIHKLMRICFNNSKIKLNFMANCNCEINWKKLIFLAVSVFLKRNVCVSRSSHFAERYQSVFRFAAKPSNERASRRMCLGEKIINQIYLCSYRKISF